MMTFAPESLLAARRYLKGQDADLSDEEVGIVGGPSHVRAGTSYHLGRDQLIMSKDPYSARTARDEAGLSNAASALDIDDDLDELRELSVWLVTQCRANAADTRDIREIIYSPDGRTVYRWDRQRGVSSEPRAGEADSSHLTHTHISWYRDSEHRDKTGVFKRFFEGDNDMNEAQAKELHNLHEMVFYNVRPWLEAFIHATDAALKAIAAKVDIDPEELEQIKQAAQAGAMAGIAATVTPETIAAAIPDELAEQIIDLLGARLSRPVQ